MTEGMHFRIALRLFVQLSTENKREPCGFNTTASYTTPACQTHALPK